MTRYAQRSLLVKLSIGPDQQHLSAILICATTDYYCRLRARCNLDQPTVLLSLLCGTTALYMDTAIANHTTAVNLRGFLCEPRVVHCVCKIHGPMIISSNDFDSHYCCTTVVPIYIKTRHILWGVHTCRSTCFGWKLGDSALCVFRTRQGMP